MRGEAEGLLVELLAAEVSPEFTGGATRAVAHVRFEAPGGLTLKGAWLTDAVASPCTAGVVTDGLVQSGPGVSMALPAALPTGEARIAFSRDRDSDGLPAAPSALDLQVDDRGAVRCIRVPFSGTEARWKPSTDWFFTGAGRSAFFLGPSPGFRAGDLFILPIGRWIHAKARIWIEPGLGPIGGGLSNLIFSIGTHGEWILVHQGSFALGVSAGYSARSTSSGYGAPQYSLIHGPETALRFKLVTPPVLGTSGFPGSVQLGSWELAVPIGYLLGTGDSTEGIGITIGLVLGVNFG